MLADRQLVDAASPVVPALSITNAQTEVSLPLLDDLNTYGCRALEQILGQVKPGEDPPVLRDCSTLEIAIVSDEEIARIHGEFLDDPTPTDVITFHHGELMLSADTAVREAGQRGWPVERELLLYLIHGALHLHGYDDHSEADQDKMWALQEEILEIIWPSEGMNGKPLTNV